MGRCRDARAAAATPATAAGPLLGGDQFLAAGAEGQQTNRQVRRTSGSETLEASQNRGLVAGDAQVTHGTGVSVRQDPLVVRRGIRLAEYPARTTDRGRRPGLSVSAVGG
jgi:hypothetical protein